MTFDPRTLLRGFNPGLPSTATTEAHPQLASVRIWLPELPCYCPTCRAPAGPVCETCGKPTEPRP